MFKGNFKNKWSIFKENSPTSHICFMIVVVNLVFIGCSALLISILPENEGHSIGELIRLEVLHVARIGHVVPEQSDQGRASGQGGDQDKQRQDQRGGPEQARAKRFFPHWISPV